MSEDAINKQMNKRAHNIIQDGIVYAFQYGTLLQKENI